jgi:hypothetical protein
MEVILHGRAEMALKWHRRRRGELASIARFGGQTRRLAASTPGDAWYIVVPSTGVSGHEALRILRSTRAS